MLECVVTYLLLVLFAARCCPGAAACSTAADLWVEGELIRLPNVDALSCEVLGYEFSGLGL